ncbi:MAG: AAA family ATPase [Chryseobacterium sp.]|nr:MAG: AAA family ATPase [Chryseobacterium sp.]
MSAQQYEKLFFDPSDNRSIPCLNTAPSEEQIRIALSQNNQKCPLNDVIVSDQNEGNMRTLRRFAFTALKRPNRSCRGCNFGIYSSSGQGKTYIVKQWAKTIGIPFVFVQSSSINDTWSLFEQIRRAFDSHEFRGDVLYTPPDGNSKFPKIIEWRSGGTDYTVPPCIVFFDEAHLIPKKMMQGGLLNAMERDDGIMDMHPAGTKSDVITANMKNVCWVAATTERGRLFDAMENRLSTAIEWHPATLSEIADIVKLRISEYVATGELPFLMTDEAYELVAKYRRIPREAISFAQKVVQQKDIMPSDTWKECVEQVARDIGIDEHGFTIKQIAILTALGQRPIAESRLADIAKCRTEQVQRFELPGLMSYDGNGPLVVVVSGKGMAITEAGLRELERRGLPHKGKKITAEHFESRKG